MTGNKSEPINIYGPEGLRMWIRTTLDSCYGRVPSKYAVHELKLGKVHSFSSLVKHLDHVAYFRRVLIMWPSISFYLKGSSFVFLLCPESCRGLEREQDEQKKLACIEMNF